MNRLLAPAHTSPSPCRRPASHCRGLFALALLSASIGCDPIIPPQTTGFAAPQQWQSVPFHGTYATLMADVNCDGKADAVGFNETDAWVMLPY